MSRRIYAVTMENGDIYGIPAEVIAHHYARYYETEHEEPYQENYDAMLHWFDTNDYEFADWAKGNLNWDDVEEQAFLLKKATPKIDFQDGWVNGEYQYITRED